MYRQCLAVNSEHSYALYNLAVLKEETTKNGDYSEVQATVVVNCRPNVVLSLIQLVTTRPSDVWTRELGSWRSEGNLELLSFSCACSSPSRSTRQRNNDKTLLADKKHLLTILEVELLREALQKEGEREKRKKLRYGRLSPV